MRRYKAVLRSFESTQSRRQAVSCRLGLEALENRRMLAAFPVSNLNDAIVLASGDAPGTLRQALFDANQSPGPDTITFTSGLTGTINLIAGELDVSDSVELLGPGSLSITIDASGNDIASPGVADGSGSRVFNVDDGELGEAINVEIRGVTITGGDVTGQGAGIRSLENLTLRDVRLTGNSVVGLNARGGGLYSYGGELLIENSTISGNSSTGDGAGGGGISRTTMLFGQQPTRIETSTVSGNTTTGSGGGIHSANNPLEPQTLLLRNSTLSGNSAGDAGGGFYNFNGSSVIEFSTITANSAGTDLGGGLASYGDTDTSTHVSSTIISGNAVTDVAVVGGMTNSLSSAGFNIIGTGNSIGSGTALDGFSATGDQTGILDPGLKPLANNGGLTQTHALTNLSPALDAGNPSASAGVGGVPSFDQRGTSFSRVRDGDGDGSARIDVGAFEFPATSADFDGDGDVDGRDFLLWQRGFGIASGATKIKGDANNDGAVNAADLGYWKTTYGTSPGPLAAALETTEVFSKATVQEAATDLGVSEQGQIAALFAVTTKTNQLSFESNEDTPAEAIDTALTESSFSYPWSILVRNATFTSVEPRSSSREALQTNAEHTDTDLDSIFAELSIGR